MRARSFVKRGVAGAAAAVAVAAAGLATVGRPGLPDCVGRLGGTAIDVVADEALAAVRGGRSAATLNAGSAAEVTTFSAATFRAEAKATVSSQVGARLTTGGGVGGVAVLGAAWAVVRAAAGRAAAACRANACSSSGPGGVGAGINAGSGPGGRPRSDSKNFRGVPRGTGGAASGGESHGCDTARAIATMQTTDLLRPRKRRARRNVAAIMEQVRVGARNRCTENGCSSLWKYTTILLSAISPPDSCRSRRTARGRRQLAAYGQTSSLSQTAPLSPAAKSIRGAE